MLPTQGGPNDADIFTNNIYTINELRLFIILSRDVIYNDLIVALTETYIV